MFILFLFRKCKSYRVPNRNTFCTRNLESVKMVTVYSQPAFKIKKQLTVTAQFQLSLSSLMETLNQVEKKYTNLIIFNSKYCLKHTGKSIFHTLH